MSEQIEIDGSLGEGGGQVLRTALTLSLITGKPFHLYNIRSQRPKPGLQPQHLTAVKAAAAVGQAEVQGDIRDSRELTFYPKKIQPGNYQFDIGTAGATTLVLQTILYPLSLADKASTIILTGGTHVPWSPSFHYLEQNWAPYLHHIGFRFKLFLEKAGFYPQGGGKVRAAVQPAGMIQPLRISERGELRRVSGISAVANLDEEIATRQKHQALRRLEPLCRETKIKTMSLPALGKGTFILLLAEFEQSHACYVALGEKGKRAEKVADEACDGLEGMLQSRAGIDEYLADQLLLPLALAQDHSELTTPRITQHLLTNATIIQMFLSVEVVIQGEIGQEAQILIIPGRDRPSHHAA